MTYYRERGGAQTGEVDSFRRALKPLWQLYGRTRASEFGLLALKAVREHMIGMGWCRSSVNRQTARIKHVFKWAAENELVPGSSYQSLGTVAGLLSGPTNARESTPGAGTSAPEQHKLGGYETWRAKSSYLEVDASPKIVAQLKALLVAP